MKIYKEYDLSELRNEFWAGAKTNVNLLKMDEFACIIAILEDSLENTMISMTQLNDFFWFDTETWSEWLGYKDFEEFWNERKKSTPEA